MRAVVVDRSRPGGIRFAADRPAPRAAGGEALIRVDAAGICATDLEIAQGYMGFEGIPGHEFVGTVLAGPNALVGRRVVGEINCPCHACETCRSGLANHCPNRTVLGILGRDGAFAEQLTLPVANCHVVPEDLSDAAAVFVEPLAAAAHVLDEFEPAAATRVALLGPGRLGVLVARVLATTPCRLTVFGRDGLRLARLRREGFVCIDVAGLRPAAEYDVVVDCTGSPEGMRLGLSLCRPRGILVLKSTYARPEAIDLAPLVINEIRLVGSRCGAFPRAIELLVSGAVRVSDLVTAEYGLEQAEDAFAAAACPAQLKVLLRPGVA